MSSSSAIISNTVSAVAQTKKPVEKSTVDQFLSLLDASNNTGNFRDSAKEESTKVKRGNDEDLKQLAAPVTPIIPGDQAIRRVVKADNEDRQGIRELAPKESRSAANVNKKGNKEDRLALRPSKANDDEANAVPVEKQLTKTSESKEIKSTDSALKAEDVKAAPVEATTNSNETAPTSETNNSANSSQQTAPSLLERINGLMTKFFDELNTVLSGGGGIESVLTLQRDLIQNIQQAIKDFFAAQNENAPEQELNGAVQNSQRLPANAALTQTTAVLNQDSIAQVTDDAQATSDNQSAKDTPVADTATKPLDTVLEKPVQQIALDKISAEAQLLDASKKNDVLKESLAASNVPAAVLTPAIAAETPKAANNNNAQALASNVQSIKAPENNTGNAGNNRDSGSDLSQPSSASVSPLNSSSKSSDNVGGASFSRLLNASTQTPVTEQVLVHIKTAVRDGSSNIRIQLHPEELGKVDIKLHVGSDGKTAVIVTADNKETLAILQRDAKGLEQALSDAGLKSDAGSLSFNLRGGNQQNESQQPFNRAAFIPPLKLEEEPIDLSVISRHYRLDVQEGLDIKI